MIDANQAGNTSYAPAPQQQQDLNVYAQEICGQQVISTQSTDGTAQSGQVSASFTSRTTRRAGADERVQGLHDVRRERERRVRTTRP